MIDGSLHIQPLIPGVAAERRPDSVKSVQDVRKEARPQTAERRILPQEREAAEDLLKRRTGDSAAVSVAGSPRNLHAQRALEAYNGLRNSGDREYVVRVLGVDERA